MTIENAGGERSPLSPDTYGEIFGEISAIAVKGTKFSAEEDSDWITPAGLPDSLREAEIIIGKRGYRYLGYTPNTILNLAARIYGENIGPNAQSVGHAHIDLQDQQGGTILGIDYSLTAAHGAVRSFRFISGPETLQQEACLQLLADLGIDPATPDQTAAPVNRIDEVEGLNLAHLLQRLKNEGSIEL